MGFFDKIMDDVLGDPFGSYHQAAEAKGAANTQAAKIGEGIEAQKAASELARQDLQPFVQQGLDAYSGLQPFIQGGQDAYGQQRAAIGLDGPEAQQAYIDQLEQSPYMQAMMQQGENALLQNASATGGLRGGNTQEALMRMRPEMMQAYMDQQYGRLGGLAGVGLQTGQNMYQMGQSSAAGQAAQGIQSAGNVANMLGQQGGVLASGQVAGASSAGSGLGQIMDIGSMATGLMGGRSLGQIGGNLQRIGSDVRGYF